MVTFFDRPFCNLEQNKAELGRMQQKLPKESVFSHDTGEFSPRAQTVLVDGLAVLGSSGIGQCLSIRPASNSARTHREPCA